MDVMFCAWVSCVCDLCACCTLLACMYVASQYDFAIELVRLLDRYLSHIQSKATFVDI
jgi:hypothetical protein